MNYQKTKKEEQNGWLVPPFYVRNMNMERRRMIYVDLEKKDFCLKFSVKTLMWNENIEGTKR